MRKFIRKPQDPFVARIVMSFVTGEFFCKICGKYFQSESGIVRHIKNSHGSEVKAKVNTEFSFTEIKQKPGVVCSFCGADMSEDEYSSGRSDCHGKDVIPEEEYA